MNRTTERNGSPSEVGRIVVVVVIAQPSLRERERERERETEKERNPNLLFYLFRLCLTAIGPGSQKLNGLSKKEYPTVMIEL